MATATLEVKITDGERFKAFISALMDLLKENQDNPLADEVVGVVEKHLTSR